MPLQATSGAASYDAFGGGVPVAINYIEDVFSTYLYTGTGASQTITNGVDLSGKGGLVWFKNRTQATFATLFDTVRGATQGLIPSETYGNITRSDSLTSFNSNGFTLGVDSVGITNATVPYVSWTFREQAKFFDVLTYTGNGTAGRTIAHNLGSVPGCIIVKAYSVDTGDYWGVYHRSLGATKAIFLSATNAAATSSIYWNNTAPTSTNFTVGDWSGVNQNGTSYVAYIFAHDAGGFGLTGTDNVISCGGFTHAGANAVQTLGYEPQFLLIKKVNDVGDWKIVDTMRGWSVAGPDLNLYPNTSGAEVDSGMYNPVATGFDWGQNGTFIYIAIRRGPMKVPTSGTSVFSPVERAGTGTTTAITGLGFTPDIVIAKATNTVRENVWFDRLRGAGQVLSSVNTSSENADANALISFDMNGVTVGADTTWYSGINNNNTGQRYANWYMKRAPSFFDEVCYTGDNASSRTITHNLGVVPEMMIVKMRSGGEDWGVYTAATGNTGSLRLNTSASFNVQSVVWNNTTPTASVFTVGSNSMVNAGSSTYVAYLFATCAGVSKVGSYTGNGTTQTINCGFTGGARFVLIKRTDSTGDWYVWDSARGIVSGNDPYLLLNSTAAEVTSTDYIDTYSAGFEISSTAPAAINASGGTFIFLAIA